MFSDRSFVVQKSKLANQSGVINKVKRLDKSATDLGQATKTEEVERVAAKVKHRAENPVDRSAELLLEEADVTNAGIAAPQNLGKIKPIER
jgi:hypothetical protein